MQASPWLDNPLWNHRAYFAAFLFLCVAVESVWRFLIFKKELDSRRVVVNSVILGVEVFLRALSYGFRMAVATVISGFAPWRIETTLLSLVVLYVGVDFIYYWRHRFLHSTKLGWAIHSTHHSSEEMTILATFRLSWVEAAIRDFFYMPLLLLGFDPLMLLFIVELNAASQFWCHTDTIGPLRFLDGWLNTPFNHRIHHAKNMTLAQKNFGSTLMCWDKWFGTYSPGQENLEYGIEGIKESFNPVVLELGLLLRLIRAGRQV